jgi:hypothetical protein
MLTRYPSLANSFPYWEQQPFGNSLSTLFNNTGVVLERIQHISPQGNTRFMVGGVQNPVPSPTLRSLKLTQSAFRNWMIRRRRIHFRRSGGRHGKHGLILPDRSMLDAVCRKRSEAFDEPDKSPSTLKDDTGGYCDYLRGPLESF